MSDILELGAGGWLRAGQPWLPKKPFYAVLGDPIGHSLSPVMQNAALSYRGVDAEYLAVRIDESQLGQLKTGSVGEMLAGFNVTAPHKQAVAALCDGRTDQARDLGAVNTVKMEDGRLLGHNTDSGGILTVLAQAWEGEAPPQRAVILGAGGSARAAVDAMLRWQVPVIEVRNRSAAGLDRLGRWLDSRGEAGRVSFGPLEKNQNAPQESSVWLSCLAGGVDVSPWVPAAGGEAPGVLLDLRYGGQLPSRPAPLGFSFIDGLPVLLMQGGLSFAWWFGPPVPWLAMRTALG